MKNGNKKQYSSEEGYVLIGVLVLVAVAAIIVASNLNISSANARTVRSGKARANEYYNAEDTLAKAITWLRANSTSLSSAFGRSQFYTKFNRGAPDEANNEGALFSIPTRLRLQGTNNAPILTSDAELGTTAFPTMTDTITAATFDGAAQFPLGDYGEDMVRITLVDAVPEDPAKDFGDTDSGNPPPETDFNPVYRIDAMRGDDRGGHVSAYVLGSLVFDYGIGFYGRDYFELRQTCDSYLSNSGAYSDASKRANCSTGSDSTMKIHQAELLYGSAKTKGVIDETNPWGGPVCASFDPGCPVAGQTCQGATCNVPGLPTYNAWATYCPVHQGNLTINAMATVTVPGNAANQKCWNKITVNSGKTLTLTTTTFSYFIDTFDIANNAVVNFAPSPATGTINIYVRKFVGDKFNGNQVFNTNNKPYQLRIHYLGVDDLDLNGTADMAAFIVAPYAGVTVSGTFSYFGGIKATDLTFTGSGKIHYDESGDITTLSDVQYKIRNIVSQYR